MNKVRRTQIQRVSDSISNIIAEIETIRDEEDETRESMPENQWYPAAYPKQLHLSRTVHCQPNFQAVSYTHLDVYKRQIHRCFKKISTATKVTFMPYKYNVRHFFIS